MKLPRLTEIGDSFTGVVESCVPEGENVRFTFEGYDEPMVRSRLGVDGAFLRMGFSFAPDRAGTDPVIDYAGVKGERLTFRRTPPTRGTTPAWRIERAGAPTVIADLPKIPDTPPKSFVTDADAKFSVPKSLEKVTAVTTGRTIQATIAKMEDADLKRAEIHTAYERELAYVLAAPLALIRKKKAEKNFDINAAVSLLMIEQAKRGCL